MRALLVTLLVFAAVAKAASLEVARAPVELLHAERLELTERFEPVRIETAVALVGSTRLDGIEISEAMTPAGTFVSRGHWTYAVTIRERDPAGVEAGVFTVTLSAAGIPTRSVTLLQAVGNPLVQEGARVVFDLGRTLPAAPHFVVTVKEVPQGIVHRLTSAITTDLEYVWQDDAQNVNPTLLAEEGRPVTFVIRSGEGTSPHNLHIEDGPVSEDVVDIGDEETLVWTPPSTGSYRYQCQYHPTMKGTIQVTT